MGIVSSIRSGPVTRFSRKARLERTEVKLSVTSWSFPACTLQEAWDITSALGIGHIDLGLLYKAGLDRAEILADPQAAAARIASMGIRAANLYWFFGATHFEREISDPDNHARNFADFEKVTDFAAALNIPTIFVLPGVARPGHSIPDLLGYSAQALNHMNEMCRTRGIQLTVEPHVGGLLGSPDMCLDLLGRVEGLKLCLDYAHFSCMGFPQNQIDPLAAHAGHIHLRQARPGALQAKMDEGTLDFVAMVECLRASDYDGFLSIEYVYQNYMNTIFDDVLTETIRMRDLMRRCAVT